MSHIISFLILVFALASAVVASAEPANLEQRAFNKILRLERIIENNTGSFTQPELRQINQHLRQAIQIARGQSVSTWTCSFSWRWNGPKSSDLGTHTFSAEGETKAQAHQNLIATCIASDIYLTDTRYCPREIKPHKAFCIER